MSDKKYYAISDERFNELRKESEEAKKEILKLPVFFTEDGKTRYISVETVNSEGDIICYYIYDEKARLIESYEFGDKSNYYFNDKSKKVTVVSYRAENGHREKGIYDVFTDEEQQKYGVWFGDRKKREREFNEKLKKLS